MASAAVKDHDQDQEVIDKASEIIKYLKDDGFGINTHWMLFLRLLGCTFDKVEGYRQHNTDNNIEQTFEDGLDEWLKNDDSSSWSKVQQVKEDLEIQNHATILLRLYESRLRAGLNGCKTLHILSSTLEASFGIGKEEISSDGIFDLVSRAVKTDPNNLMKLVNIILRDFNDKNINRLANDLQRECSIHHLGCQNKPLLRDSSLEKSIPLSPTLEESFTEIIEIEFHCLLSDCIKLIVEAYSSLDDGLRDFKTYLTKLNIQDRELENCTSIEDMVKLFITQKNSVLNTAHLKNLLKECHIDSGLKAIREYKEKLNKACEKIKVNKMISKHLRHGMDTAECETITFIVKWEVTDAVLKDIEQLLELAFEELGCEVHVVRCDKGNSIIITCYAPQAIIGLLIFKAQQNLSLLKKKGVMSLKIGYCTLLDHKKNFEINKPLLEELEELWKEKKKLSDEIFDAKAELKNIKIEIEDHPSSMRISEEGIKMTAKMQEVQGDTPVEKGTHQEVISPMQKSIQAHLFRDIENLKGQNRSLESEISKLKESKPTEPEISPTALKQTLESRIPVLHFHSKVQYPPFDIMMNSFSVRKKQKEHWYSPSFYSHPGGYKMCLKLRADGQNEGKDTHLSAFLHIMSGDYDHRLSWPFKGEIKLQLLNQRADDNHIKTSIVIDESSDVQASGRVMGGVVTDSGIAAQSGEGIAKLIEHNNLGHNPATGTEYLQGDTVFIRINEVVIKETALAASISPSPTSREPWIAELRLENYSKLRRKSEKWKSDPFYTSPPSNGYSFLLAVHANGKRVFSGKCISVYTHLLKGDNDGSLSFPFRGIITIQLVNQREDKNHVEASIRYTKAFDPKGRHGNRVTGFSPLSFAGLYENGAGFDDFVEQKDLELNKSSNIQFLTDNDELVFRIFFSNELGLDS